MNNIDDELLMISINKAMKRQIEGYDCNTYQTTKDITKLVLVATVNEFIITDRDKFQALEISKNNRFLI